MVKRIVYPAKQILATMGLRYVVARTAHECLRRTGLLQFAFPRTVRATVPYTLQAWRDNPGPFFFPPGGPRQKPGLSVEQRNALVNEARAIRRGKVRFFSGKRFELGRDYDWVTNPESGYRFDVHQHWTKISDLSRSAGDIKYVWEKSRFCYLYTLMRDEWLNGNSHSDFVFSEIQSWLDHNPLNCGPNYRCSQEMSIRVLTWIWILYFYRDAPTLSSNLFTSVLTSIYWQTHHIERNLWFARYTVRNNHLITEALCLYVVGTIFASFDCAERWRRKGKSVLTTEARHQILPDGTYTQYSFNYHRVVVQDYCLALRIARLYKDSLGDEVHTRLECALDFLWHHQDDTTGRVPNYGQNDGSLFFPLSSCEYRDYRPQLQALHCALHSDTRLFESGPWDEESLWFGLDMDNRPVSFQKKKTFAQFSHGGFYVARRPDAFVMIRCGNHCARPSHADNLHLDLWFHGENVLRDAGTYSYNTDRDTLLAFMGTPAHNTAYLPAHHQMEKGPRFIWYHWSGAEHAEMRDEGDWIVFTGTIHAFAHVRRDITHTRTVRQNKKRDIWEVNDTISGWTGPVCQSWNLGPGFTRLGFILEARNTAGTMLPRHTVDAWYSDTYGRRERADRIIFEAPHGAAVNTLIAHA